MSGYEVVSLREALSGQSDLDQGFIASDQKRLALRALYETASLAVDPADLRGRAVLIATEDQFAAARALVDLDGVARRMVLLPPGIGDQHIASLVADKIVDAVVSDGEALPPDLPPVEHIETGGTAPRTAKPVAERETEWILMTSGTTGMPKLVAHTLKTLSGAIKRKAALGEAETAQVIWSTFYDIRRYGGLQILLRALLGGGSLVLSDSDEAVGDFLLRAGKEGVTHVSGTPSHWRRALMSPDLARLAPRYVRLSGEIADQAILDNLRRQFPAAKIGHAFASTEAGVGFEVEDGLAGFPAAWVGRAGGPVDLRVIDGTLRIRSSRTASAYLNDKGALADEDGYIDTGDIVELRGDRYHFIGRRGGLINIGGLKVYPEEIECVVNGHPKVKMSRVKARRNPVTGSIAVAEIVLRGEGQSGADAAALKADILDHCRARLAPHKVPAVIEFVTGFAVSSSGKIARQ